LEELEDWEDFLFFDFEIYVRPRIRREKTIDDLASEVKYNEEKTKEDI
jgi:hypothetical protein